MWPLLYESFGKRLKDFDRLVVRVSLKMEDIRRYYCLRVYTSF